MKNNKIICLVGPSGAGKSTVANLLTDNKNVRYISLSNKVREYVTRLGIENPTRAILQTYANRLRQDKGNGVFAQMVVDSFEDDCTYNLILVDGVRHPSEIEILRSSQVPVFVLGITSDQQKRFERVIQRQRPSDPKTWEDFVECDKRENGEMGNDHQQENAKCLKMADFIIHNDGGFQELHIQLVTFLKNILEFNEIHEFNQKIQ